MISSRISVWLLPLLVLTACASTPSSSSYDDEDWLKPSPNLREQIERHSERLPWAQRLEDRVELIRWFAGVGEPAYPTLLDLAADERPHVAGTALAALGGTGDPRLIPYVQPLSWKTEDRSVELEKARCLASLGDWSQTRVLIDALRSDDTYVRAISARTLKVLTGESMGFDAKAEVQEREASVKRWESWWSASQG